MDLAVDILSLYISSDEISRGQLRALVEKSYSTFRHPEVTPVKKLGERTYVLELFHGPTFAFKDVALQFLGNLFEFFLARRNAKKEAGEKQEQVTVVGATSGDTGRCVLVFMVIPCVLMFEQCCYLRATRKSERVDLHPAPQGSRISHSRSSNDDGH